jgi:hypothetical protein
MIQTILAAWPALLFSLSPALLNETSLPAETNLTRSLAGEFYARFEYGAGTSEFVPIARFELFDRSGRSVYLKNDFRHTLFDIADDGRVVGIDFDGPVSGRAKLHFYDPDGREAGTAEIGFLATRQFSRDASVYAVLDGLAGLRLFDVSGAELYDLGPGQGFTLSGDGRTCGLVRDEAIVLYRDGVETGRIPGATPFIRGIKLSCDGSRLAFIDRKNLYLYECPAGRLLGRYQETDPELNFISLDLTTAGLALAGLDRDAGRGRPGRHQSGCVYLFDEEASIQWRETVRYESWDITLPAVEFLPDNHFRIKTDQSIREYGY